MKKALILAWFFGVGATLLAQHSTDSYEVLKIPVSSHVAALGGENISLVEDNPAAGWNNPAMLSAVSDNSLGLDFMTYGHATQYMGAQFVKAFGSRHTAAIQAQLLNYGSMDETDEAGNVIGSVSAKDVVVSLGYSYLLSDRWAGGASLKMTTQAYAGYTSFAMGVDLGLNYYDEDNDFSTSIALRNCGAQIKNFYDGEMLHLPFIMQIGVSKGLAHLPVRFHLTATDLTRWKSSYYYHPADVDKIGFGRKLLNHFVVGVEVLPTKWMYIAAGYNLRRAYELKSADKSKLGGLTLGAGLAVKKFRFGMSYARYHVSTNAFQFNLAYSFSK